MPDLAASLPDIATTCIGCGREFATHEVRLYRFSFPASRICAICREAEKAEEDGRRAEVLFEQANVPRAYRHCDLAGFQRVPGTREAHELASQWAQNYRRGGERRGLFFYGPPGSGKTHLAVALLREAIWGEFARCLFLNVPEWLEAMRDAIQGLDVPELPSPRGFSVIVLDDIGIENSTAWTRDQIYNLVNHRETNRLLTIVTSNLGRSELAGRLGRATISRLDRLCRPIELSPTEDFRLRDGRDERANGAGGASDGEE